MGGESMHTEVAARSFRPIGWAILTFLVVEIVTFLPAMALFGAGPFTLLVQLVIAFLAARHVYFRADDPGTLLRIALYGLVVGLIGFAAGFFGPMILAPRANQGPLLGIFVTGPLGVLLGLAGGIVRSRRRAG